jgi:DNA-binding response OmpR family regulator
MNQQLASFGVELGGADAYLAKPISMEGLAAVIAKVARPSVRESVKP